MAKKTRKSRKSKKAWSGRFSKAMAKSAEEFSSSVHVDVRLYKYDIAQSMAYAKALIKTGVLTTKESSKIIKALIGIEKGLEAGKIKLRPELEDIHMNIETLLIEKVGSVGKKLHSGRSRNDQVATDFRMYTRDECIIISDLVIAFQEVLVELAEKNIKVIAPGYTHLQKAQPILLSHHLMAYYEMLERDKKRLECVRKEADVITLGSGALAGTNFKVDRAALAKDLGFADVSKNSMDAVSDRDFAIDLAHACSIIMMHLSRFAEELIIWSSFEFNFIELCDQYTTGSSIMPQKKNPDMAELSRGKTGRVYGNLMTILTLMKGLPLAYNRDMQEDKEAVFDSVDTVKATLSIFAEMVATVKINADKMDKAAKKGFLTATDLAYYLVNRGVPFREAHEVVGKIVAYCVDSNMQLEYMSLQQLKKFSKDFGYDATKILSAQSSVQAKDCIGGTAPKRVKEAIKRAQKNLAAHKA